MDQKLSIEPSVPFILVAAASSASDDCKISSLSFFCFADVLILFEYILLSNYVQEILYNVIYWRNLRFLKLSGFFYRFQEIWSTRSYKRRTQSTPKGDDSKRHILNTHFLKAVGDIKGKKNNISSICHCMLPYWHNRKVKSIPDITKRHRSRQKTNSLIEFGIHRKLKTRLLEIWRNTTDLIRAMFLTDAQVMAHRILLHSSSSTKMWQISHSPILAYSCIAAFTS